MTDTSGTDRIDIEITDKIAATIESKITQIGRAALGADAAVEKLKLNLASISVGNLSVLEAKLGTIAATMSKVTKEQTALTTAQSQGGVAAERLATAQARTLAASERAATAAARSVITQNSAELSTLKLAAAKDKLAAAELREAEIAKLAAESSVQKPIIIHDRAVVQQATNSTIGAEVAREGTGTTVADTALLAQQARKAELDKQAIANAGKLRIEYDKSYASTLRLADAEHKYNDILALTAAHKEAGRLDAGAASAVEAGALREFEAAKKAASGLDEVERSAGRATHGVRGLSTILRETTVIIREAGRGDFSRLAGSASILGQALIGVSLTFIPILAGLGAVVVGTIEWHRELNTANAGAIKDYVNGLGLTTKEMRKLKDVTVDSKGSLKEHNVLLVTYGDIFHGIAKTISQDTAALIKSALNLETTNKSSISSILRYLKEFGLVFVYTAITVIEYAKAVGHSIGDMAAAIVHASRAQSEFSVGDFKGAADDAKKAVQDVVDSGKDLVGGVLGAHQKALAGTTALYKGVADTVKQTNNNILESTKERLKKEADAIKAHRTPKKERQHGESESIDPLDSALIKARSENVTLKSNALTKDEYNIQSELNRVVEEQTAKYGALNSTQQAELVTLRNLLEANAKEKQIQDSVRNTLREADKAQHDYNLALETRNRLTGASTVAQEHANASLILAHNILFDQEKGITAESKALEDASIKRNLFGDILQRELFIRQRLEEAYRNPLKPLDKTDAAGITKARGAASSEFDAQQTAADIHKRFDPLVAQEAENKLLLANKKKYFDALNQLEKDNLISHETAQRTKVDLEGIALKDRVGLNSDAFGTLLDLQKSSVREIAAVGKAAAIAQATVDGYVAVQKALTAAPPPFNFALAALVGAAAAANVAKIAGFEAGGYTGNAGRQQVAGVVHGQEYVFDAKSTARLGVGTLEALRRGATPGYEDGGYVTNDNRTFTNVQFAKNPTAPQAHGKAGDVHVTTPASKIINLIDPKDIPKAMASSEGEKVTLNHIKLNGPQVGAYLNG